MNFPARARSELGGWKIQDQEVTADGDGVGSKGGSDPYNLFSTFFGDNSTLLKIGAGENVRQTEM